MIVMHSSIFIVSSFPFKCNTIFQFIRGLPAKCSSESECILWFSYLTYLTLDFKCFHCTLWKQRHLDMQNNRCKKYKHFFSWQVHMHGSNYLQTLQQHFPKILPSEYGGEADSMEELSREWTDFITESAGYLQSISQDL